MLPKNLPTQTCSTWSDFKIIQELKKKTFPRSHPQTSCITGCWGIGPGSGLFFMFPKWFWYTVRVKTPVPVLTVHSEDTYYWPPFMGKETEAQGGKLSCPKLQQRSDSKAHISLPLQVVTYMTSWHSLSLQAVFTGLWGCSQHKIPLFPSFPLSPVPLLPCPKPHCQTQPDFTIQSSHRYTVFMPPFGW